jgi:hypothetical protein
MGWIWLTDTARSARRPVTPGRLRRPRIRGALPVDRGWPNRAWRRACWARPVRSPRARARRWRGWRPFVGRRDGARSVGESSTVSEKPAGQGGGGENSPEQESVGEAAGFLPVASLWQPVMRRLGVGLRVSRVLVDHSASPSRWRRGRRGAVGASNVEVAGATYGTAVEGFSGHRLWRRRG